MRWSAVLAGLVAGTIAGCLLELGDRKACGDGFHDPEHEDCDPNDLESVPSACSCDSETCTLNCCGDGVIGGPEECEGTNWKVRPPCLGWTCENCEVTCPSNCGNGMLDANEECDFESAAIATQPTSCEMLTIPGREDEGEKYVAGGNPTCRSDCTWDRTTCSLCGNGIRDVAIVHPNGTVLRAEEHCDGEDFNMLLREARCLAVCGEGRDCKVTCGESCLELEVDPADKGCCVRGGEARAAGVPCCCELPADEVPESCSGVFDPPLSGEMPTSMCPS